MLPKTFNPPREREKKEFPKFLKILIILVIILGGLIYLFFYSPLFKIKNILIEIPIPQESVQFLEKFKGQNIFFVDISSMKKDLSNHYPEYENVQIQRGLPDTLRISGDIFEPSIVWHSGINSYLVNASGIAFKEFEGMTDLPNVQDNKELNVELQTEVVSANFINFIQDLSSKFPQKIGFNITGFEINETIFQVDAPTDQGWLVKFDTTRSVDSQLDALSKLISEHKDEIKEYADVRVEGRIYYK